MSRGLYQIPRQGLCPLPPTKSPFSQPIERHNTCHSFSPHFSTAYDGFCGSFRAVPTSRKLGIAAVTNPIALHALNEM